MRGKAPACATMSLAMSFVRLFVAWLLMAALPLQGIAAASMLFCDQNVASAAAGHEEHSGHDHHHAQGHESVNHQSSHAAKADAHPHADAVQSADDDQQSVNAEEAAHACPICASGCHLVALSESLPSQSAADSPSAVLPQPTMPALSRATPRPDKPPRA